MSMKVNVAPDENGNNPIFQIRSSAGTEPNIGAYGNGDGNTSLFNHLGVGGYGLSYNESSWDRVRGNTQGTLLASAARTTGLYGPTLTNYNARGVVVYVNVTAISGTSPNLQLQFGMIDPISGSQNGYSTSSTTITATGQYFFVLYPSALSGLTNSVGMIQLPLPRSWYVYYAIGGTTPSITFSSSYLLIL